jgi:hypothetical protein
MMSDKPAAPAPEPVAWMHLYKKISGGAAYQQADIGEHGPDPDDGYKHVGKEPLYAHPAPVAAPAPVYNPWRESLENCISGDNYLRAQEYRDLIEELDDLYRRRAQDASPAPVAAPDADAIMALADEWYAHGQTSHSGIDEKYAALRAAVEQLCADLQFAQRLATKNGDEVISERIRAERAERERDEWKSAADAATELARHNHERAERAEPERDAAIRQIKIENECQLKLSDELERAERELERLKTAPQELVEAFAGWPPTPAQVEPLLRAEQECRDKEEALRAVAAESLRRLDGKIAAEQDAARLRETLIRIVRDGILNAPCPTPGQWEQLRDVARQSLDAAMKGSK